VASTVVDPRWVTPVDPALLALAARHRLVVTLEDGVLPGGVGSRLSQELRGAGVDVPTRDLGVPARFLPHARVPALRAELGLTAQDVARQVVGWVSGLDPDGPSADRAGHRPADEVAAARDAESGERR
jgi:1-deoxy-D-xylulose-5-phosphate synthase